MEDLREILNKEQYEAVTSTEGMIRVIAGAGSGKTRALSYRFAYLVNEVGILPENILCVTFTNKAANEMRQRIHNLTGDNDTGYINTFHGFCVSVLQEDSNVISYPKSFLVLDNSDIDEMLKIIYEERGLSLRDMTFSNARDMIEILKLYERPDYYLDIINMSLDVLHEKYLKAETVKDIIFYGYLYQEKKCFGVDYNDLIIFSLHIFKERSDIREKWHRRLEYIMIDEFQDIDEPQYRLMEVLCDYHKNLFIVGDPDQTVYTWRGAKVTYLLDFDKRFDNVKTIMMMQNYRSKAPIINAANSLVDKNKTRIKKELVPTLGDGENVVCHFAENAEKEADFIAEKIKDLISNGEKLSDIAILYRAHYVTRTIEDSLMKNEIPYTIYSGVQFFARAEIKDALSYLRMIVYKDDLSFLRIANTPKRNIGERRIKHLKEYSEKHSVTLYQALKECIDDSLFKSTGAAEFIDLIEKYSANYSERQISELFSALMNDSGYEKMLRTVGSQERLDNLAELKQSVFDYETTCGEEATLEGYLTHIALYTNTDMPETNGKIKLMTVHASKGLEFNNLFICGMNEGIFPSRKIKTKDAMEEERRLAFVAVTRARERLFITEADGRNLDGSPRYPSRFILDIGAENLEFTKEPREGLIKETKEYILNKNLWLSADDLKPSDVFEKGTIIKHSVFGEGKIMDADTTKKAYLIRFDGMDTDRVISFKVKLTAVG